MSRGPKQRIPCIIRISNLGVHFGKNKFALYTGKYGIIRISNLGVHFGKNKFALYTGKYGISGNNASLPQASLQRSQRSYCLRDWPLYHTRCCIRKKKPTFENNDLSARGDFSVNPATFYHSLGILVLIAQLNFCAQPVNQIYEVKYCILPRTSL